MRLGLRREILRHVQFSQGLADGALDQRHASLPAHLVHRRPVEHGAVERKILVRKGFVQIRCKGAQQPPREVALPDRQGRRLEETSEAVQVTRLADDHGARLARDSGGGKEAAPIVLRRKRPQLRDGELVVGLHRVAIFHVGPLAARESGFQRDDGGRLASG